MFRTEAQVRVDEADPYKMDWLDRKEWVQKLAADVHNSVGGVLGLRGGVGTGKTTLMRMLEAELKTMGKRTVYVDLWKSDFVDSAFVALTAGVLEGLPEAGREEVLREGNRLATQFAQWKEPLRNLLKTGYAAGERSMEMDGTSELVGMGVDAVIETTDTVLRGKKGSRDTTRTDEERLREYDGRRIERYTETLGRMEAFRDTLMRATEFNENEQGMVLLIDELDRCRPSYAVEVLEIAKHLFQIPNIVFIIAFNPRALQASMQHAYGQQFPAREYLDRFFDLAIDISSGNVAQYIQKHIRGLGLGDSFGMAGPTHRLPGGVVNGILTSALEEKGADLRRIKKALHQIDLIWSRSGYEDTRLPEMLATLMLLRIKDESLYERLMEGTTSDREVIEKVTDGTEPPQTWEEGKRNLFACIMYASRAIGARTGRDVSSLYDEYVKSLPSSKLSAKDEDENIKRRRLVVEREREVGFSMGEGEQSWLWVAAASINLDVMRK